MCQGPSWWTWSLEQWTLSGLDLMDKSSGQTILCLDSQELETTGPKDITLKVDIQIQ